MEPFNIFDFDGTLADSMYVWSDSAPQLLREAGREPAPDLTRRLVHLNLTDSLRLMKREYQLPQSEEDLRQMVLDRVEKEYRFRIQPKPGAERVLKTLQDRGCRCCVATSTDSWLVQAALERMGLAEYFAFVLTTRPGAGKDKPDIYLEALERLGGSRPGQAAVFEDSPRCLATAVAAGFQVYALEDACSDPDEYPAGLRARLKNWQDWSENL